MDLNMKILVVNDYSTMGQILKGALKQIGFTKIIEADNGNAALEMLKREEIGLILADWNMPKMTGIDLLKVVKSDETLKDIPFLMVTAEGQKRDILEAAKAGVSDYITKPFTPEALEEKIKKVLLIAESRGIFDKK